MTIPAPPTALFVANYAPNTGYAWDFIERLYAALADRLRERGVRSLVAYPSLASSPATLESSAAAPIDLSIDFHSLKSIRALSAVIRRENIRLLYLTDRPTRSLTFPLLRWAGVRWIISHDHTSGARTAPRGLRRLAKRLENHVPGTLADRIVAVSEYVARRQRDVVLAPPDRVTTVHNGVPLGEIEEEAARGTHEQFGIDPSRTILGCACRAHPVKGVHHLLRAFDLAVGRGDLDPPPVLLFLGDGPQMEELQGIKEGLSSRDQIVLGGFHPNADEALRGVSLMIVPSVWQDAFPLSVLQPMARGKAVIASRVGGIPEMIEDGVSGLLVTPGDEQALASAIRGLLRRPREIERLGSNARERVARRFRPEAQIQALADLLEEGLARL